MRFKPPLVLQPQCLLVIRHSALIPIFQMKSVRRLKDSQDLSQGNALSQLNEAF